MEFSLTYMNTTGAQEAKGTRERVYETGRVTGRLVALRGAPPWPFTGTRGYKVCLAVSLFLDKRRLDGV